MTDTGTGLLFGGLSRATSVPSSSRSRPTTKWQRHSLKCCARRSQLSAYLGGCFQCGGAFQKDKIKEQKPNELARVDSPDLRVWKLRNPQKSKEIMRTEYLANLRRLDDVPGNGDQGDDEVAWRLRATDKISVHLSELPRDRIFVLVQVAPLLLNIGRTVGSIRHGREFSIHLLAPAYHVGHTRFPKTQMATLCSTRRSSKNTKIFSSR